MRIKDDFFNEKPDWLQILVSIIVFLSFLAIIGVGLFLAEQAFAYDRVLFNAGTGYATSSAGTVEKMTSGNTNVNGIYVIDCEKLGIAEIASTTVSLYVDTSTRTGFNIMDGASGRLSDNSYTIDATARDYSFTFTPPLWCKDSRLLLMGEAYVTRAVNWSVKGATGASSADAIPYAYCVGNGTGCTTSTINGQDIAIIAEGTWATSTPSTGGGTTTNNYYLEVSSSTPDGLNLIGGVSLVGLSLLFFLAGVISIVWLVRTFWR